nr:MAG TPA: hypothetical protein [Caudoviricetes sp.]
MTLKQNSGRRFSRVLQANSTHKPYPSSLDNH